ncbi:LysE family translocator, partial [Rhizobium ruizarguesonis]
LRHDAPGRAADARYRFFRRGQDCDRGLGALFLALGVRLALSSR